jgi:arylsulfatase A-like enzyme
VVRINLTLWTALLFASPAALPAADRPNVLMIFADDLGYADLGIHGGRDVPTPHIDALARSGVRCTSGYVASPYCSPSRAGMLTGRAPTRFGHEFNPHVGDEAILGLPLDQRTIADELQSAGYATALVGKWHQGFAKPYHPQARGFDEFFGFLVGGHNFELRADAEPEFGSSLSRNMIYRGTELQKLDGFTTELFTDEALSFVERHADRPWFLFLSFNAVHTPLEISPMVADRIPADVTDPDRRGYLALLLGLDDAIGRVRARLRAMGADRNTLVFFLSDNGGSGRKPFLSYNTGRNTPFRGDKGQTYEGGIRVPFFVSWPGRLPAGATYDQPVSALDVLPTACAAAGVQPKSVVEGVNLLPFLTGDNRSAPHTSLAWRFGPQKALRQGDWKIVDARDFETKSQSGWQLYNLAEDISESHDLSATYPEKKAELIRAWEQWDKLNVEPKWHGRITEDPTAPSADVPAKTPGTQR